MILGVHHAAMAVPNIQIALDFYCGVLGFEVTMEAEVPAGVNAMCEALGTEDSAFKVRMLKKAESRLELFEFESAQTNEPGPPNRIGITHIALSTDNIEEDYSYLLANSVSFNTPPFGEAPNRFAYGRDPFGNIIELLEQAEAREKTDRSDKNRSQQQ